MPTCSKLNARQEAFCRGLAEGKPASRSYAEAGYDARGNAAEVEASRLVRNPKVRARLAELQAKHAKKLGKTVADIVADLDLLHERAIASGQLSAAVSAIMGIARILGMLNDSRSRVEQVQYKPSRISTARSELSEQEWREQFDPAYKAT